MPTAELSRRVGKVGVWYLRYRLPDGSEHQRRLGPAWEGPGRPPEGHHAKRTAHDALRSCWPTRAGARSA